MDTSWMNDYTACKIDPFNHELPIISCPVCRRPGKLYSNNLRVVHKYSALIGAGKWDACDVSDQQLTDCLESYRNPIKREPKKRGRPKKDTIAYSDSHPSMDDTLAEQAITDMLSCL